MSAALKIIVSLSSLAMFSACSLSESKHADMLNARLVESTPSAVNHIQTAISPMLNGEIVHLQKDVFTHSSQLIVASNTVADKHGNVVNGNDTSGFNLATGELVPSGERFYLKTQHQRCFIFHEQSATLIELTNLKCQPEI